MRLSALHCKNSTGAILSQSTCIVQYTQQSEKLSLCPVENIQVSVQGTQGGERLWHNTKVWSSYCFLVLCACLSSVTTTTKKGLKKKSLPVHSSLCSSLASFKVLWPLLIFECCLQVVQGNKSFELCVSVCVCSSHVFNLGFRQKQVLLFEGRVFGKKPHSCWHLTVMKWLLKWFHLDLTWEVYSFISDWQSNTRMNCWIGFILSFMPQSALINWIVLKLQIITNRTFTDIQQWCEWLMFLLYNSL